jgi:DNA-binding NarL/FixJ family response regulator
MKRLVAVIQMVYAGDAGDCYLSPHIAAKVLQIVRGGRPLTPDRYFSGKLTRTELRIIHLVSLGLENQEIADILGLNIGTIRNYITAILRKTFLRNRVELAVFAIQNGLKKEAPKSPARGRRILGTLTLTVFSNPSGFAAVPFQKPGSCYRG